ncbi:MAG: citrate transporter [Clostridia bacterium]|nr:citrate transporter [Clostridia bacterium]
MLTYLKKEKVLTISLVLAVASMFLVKPDAGYKEYIDWRVLALLFGLMLIVKGFQGIGLFDLLIRKAFSGVKNVRRLAQLLTAVCFFSSMLITNDVALITFVPFGLIALSLCGQEKRAIPIVVLETIAANLGSMATPVGNPQNLYLFSASGMPLAGFFASVLPVAFISFVLLMLASLLIPAEPIQMKLEEKKDALNKLEMGVYSVLFIVNLLVVFRVIHFLPALLLTIAGVLAVRKPRLLLQADYALLLTFVGFFVFVGNLGRVELIREWISSVLLGREILVSALFSQVISNVPAAILLSGFTDNFSGLLIGANIGGLGTIIASMASLISYKLYAAQPGADKTKYMLVFTLYNAIGLVLLLGLCVLAKMG